MRTLIRIVLLTGSRILALLRQSSRSLYSTNGRFATIGSGRDDRLLTRGLSFRRASDARQEESAVPLREGILPGGDNRHSLLLSAACILPP